MFSVLSAAASLSSSQSAITGALPQVNCSVMRKRLITPISHDAPPVHEGWMELAKAAVVEVTSEEKEYPVESALVPGETRGWRAADSGAQTIRLLFDKPQLLGAGTPRELKNRAGQMFSRLLRSLVVRDGGGGSCIRRLNRLTPADGTIFPLAHTSSPLAHFP
jgi:hypothetical protein